MANEKSYNGWTNYETWNVNLWIDNEQGSQEYWREQAEDAYRDAAAQENWTRAERAALDLADRLKAEHEEAQPELSGVWADLLGAALSEVNWYEIATSMIGDLDTDAIDAEEADDDETDEEE